MKFIIRKATPKDARSISEVNAYTWNTTYKGLIPDTILEERIKKIEERIPKIISDIENLNNYFVATINEKVVGIMSYGKSRNNNYPNYGELYSIYVLKDYQGLDIGKSLLKIAFQELSNLGYKEMILNVLEGNKTIHFYEKYGGVKIGKKEDKISDFILKENIIYFSNIKKSYKNILEGCD